QKMLSQVEDNKKVKEKDGKKKNRLRSKIKDKNKEKEKEKDDEIENEDKESKDEKELIKDENQTSPQSQTAQTPPSSQLLSQRPVAYYPQIASLASSQLTSTSSALSNTQPICMLLTKAIVMPMKRTETAQILISLLVSANKWIQISTDHLPRQTQIVLLHSLSQVRNFTNQMFQPTIPKEISLHNNEYMNENQLGSIFEGEIGNADYTSQSSSGTLMMTLQSQKNRHFQQTSVSQYRRASTLSIAAGNTIHALPSASQTQPQPNKVIQPPKPPPSQPHQQISQMQSNAQSPTSQIQIYQAQQQVQLKSQQNTQNLAEISKSNNQQIGIGITVGSQNWENNALEEQQIKEMIESGEQHAYWLGVIRGMKEMNEQMKIYEEEGNDQQFGLKNQIVKEKQTLLSIKKQNPNIYSQIEQKLDQILSSQPYSLSSKFSPSSSYSHNLHNQCITASYLCAAVLIEAGNDWGKNKCNNKYSKPQITDSFISKWIQIVRIGIEGGDYEVVQQSVDGWRWVMNELRSRRERGNNYDDEYDDDDYSNDDEDEQVQQNQRLKQFIEAEHLVHLQASLNPLLIQERIIYSISRLWKQIIDSKIGLFGDYSNVPLLSNDGHCICMEQEILNENKVQNRKEDEEIQQRENNEIDKDNNNEQKGITQYFKLNNFNINNNKPKEQIIQQVGLVFDSEYVLQTSQSTTPFIQFIHETFIEAVESQLNTIVRFLFECVEYCFSSSPQCIYQSLYQAPSHLCSSQTIVNSYQNVQPNQFPILSNQSSSFGSGASKIISNHVLCGEAFFSLCLTAFQISRIVLQAHSQNLKLAVASSVSSAATLQQRNEMLTYIGRAAQIQLDGGSLGAQFSIAAAKQTAYSNSNVQTLISNPSQQSLPSNDHPSASPQSQQQRFQSATSFPLPFTLTSTRSGQYYTPVPHESARLLFWRITQTALIWFAQKPKRFVLGNGIVDIGQQIENNNNENETSEDGWKIRGRINNNYQSPFTFGPLGSSSSSYSSSVESYLSTLRQLLIWMNKHSPDDFSLLHPLIQLSSLCQIDNVNLTQFSLDVYSAAVSKAKEELNDIMSTNQQLYMSSQQVEFKDAIIQNPNLSGKIKIKEKRQQKRRRQLEKKVHFTDEEEKQKTETTESNLSDPPSSHSISRSNSQRKQKYQQNGSPITNHRRTLSISSPSPSPLHISQKMLSQVEDNKKVKEKDGKKKNRLRSKIKDKNKEKEKEKDDENENEDKESKDEKELIKDESKNKIQQISLVLQSTSDQTSPQSQTAQTPPSSQLLSQRPVAYYPQITSLASSLLTSTSSAPSNAQPMQLIPFSQSTQQSSYSPPFSSKYNKNKQIPNVQIAHKMQQKLQQQQQKELLQQFTFSPTMSYALTPRTIVPNESKYNKSSNSSQLKQITFIVCFPSCN
ncbi:MAG: hypothetical protein EZS28_021972, partial [Streblomastix strix]